MLWRVSAQNHKRNVIYGPINDHENAFLYPSATCHIPAKRSVKNCGIGRKKQTECLLQTNLKQNKSGDVRNGTRYTYQEGIKILKRERERGRKLLDTPGHKTISVKGNEEIVVPMMTR